MALVAGLCRTPAKESLALRVCNIVLSVLTLLVIATAFSKMGLYIAMHGFTPKRIMTCVFMIFLAGTCFSVIFVQFKSFSVVRFAAFFGSALLCALCLCNLDGMVVSHNAKAYLKGQLAVFDEVIVMRSGPAGVEKAHEMLQQMDDADPEKKKSLAYAVYRGAIRAEQTRGTATDCLVNARVRALGIGGYSSEELSEMAKAYSERR